jgi:ubiquinone/menaquinone biosynthesis C-methylase UbiE
MSNQFSDNKKFIEEYDLFGKVFPFHNELQSAIPEAIGKHFSSTEDLKFLDIGAGYGFTTRLVAEKFPSAHFILNEFDDNLLSQSDEYLKNFSIDKRLGDIEEISKKSLISRWMLCTRHG